MGLTLSRVVSRDAFRNDLKGEEEDEGPEEEEGPAGDEEEEEFR